MDEKEEWENEDEETNLEEVQFHVVHTRQPNYLKQEIEELHIGQPHRSAAGGQMAIHKLLQGIKNSKSESSSK